MAANKDRTVMYAVPPLEKGDSPVAGLQSLPRARPFTSYIGVGTGTIDPDTGDVAGPSHAYTDEHVYGFLQGQHRRAWAGSKWANVWENK